MWIVLNKSFLSIVKNRNNENQLLVRARVNGDIEKVFPDADIFQDKDADYKYRSYIDREVVANAIGKELLNINYDNFKSSVSKDDGIRGNAYMKVWMALNQMQN